MAIPYHAADSELVGTAYAVLNPTTGEFDFVRSTETHENKSTGTVKSISGGTYTGTIYTGFETGSRSWYSVAESVKTVRFVDAVRPSGTGNWFGSMRNCTSMDLSKLDTSQVTNMNQTFCINGAALTSLDLSSFDTSSVTSMNWMFGGCRSLTSLDLSSFDTSNVTTMYQMFAVCTNLSSLDLSSFDTSSVTSMKEMFWECWDLTSLNLSSFDTSKVTNMHGMFSECYDLTQLDLSNFDTSKVTDMGKMFYNCTSLNKLTVGDKFVIN